MTSMDPGVLALDWIEGTMGFMYPNSNFKGNWRSEWDIILIRNWHYSHFKYSILVFQSVLSDRTSWRWHKSTRVPQNWQLVVRYMVEPVPISLLFDGRLWSYHLLLVKYRSRRHTKMFLCSFVGMILLTLMNLYQWHSYEVRFHSR